MPYIEATGRLDFLPAPAASQVLSIEDAPGVTADQELTIDRLAVLAMQGLAVAGKPLEISLEVYVDGTMVDRDKIESVSVQESLSQDFQGWSFSTGIKDGVFLFGSPWEVWGCGLARKAVTIKAAIRRGTQVARYPLITDGVAAEEDPDGEPINGWGETFAGYDRGARLDGTLVTLTVPTGHGLTRGALKRALLAKAGETLFKLQGGRRLLKPQVFIDQDPVRSGREIGEPEGRVLLVDREGFWTDPVVGIRGDAPLSGTIGPFDILGGEDATKPGPPVKVRVCRDPLTDVTFTAYQILEKPVEEACGRTFSPARSTLVGSFAPRVAAFVQSGAGTLSSSGLTEGPPRPNTPIQRTVIERESRCGIVVRESKSVYGWIWPETRRHVVAGGDIDPVAGVYLWSDGTEGGSEPAHEGTIERWTLLQREETRHYYLKPGYTRTGSAQVGTPEEHLAGGLTNVGTEHWDGRYLGSITTIEGFYHPRAALKDRTGILSTPFEEVDLIEGRLILGNGTGVEEATESFRVKAREIRVQVGRYATSDHSGGLLLDSATVYREGYAANPGSVFQYADGRNYTQEVEAFQLLGYEVEQFLEVGDAYASVTTTVDSIEGTSTSRFDDVDGIPTVERIADPEAIDEALYDDPAEAEARGVDGGRQTVKRRVVDPDLEAIHGKRELRTELPGAEDEEDLQAAVIGTIQRSAYFAVSFQTILAVLPRLGQWWRVWYPPLGIDIVGQVHSLTHEGPQGIRAARVTTWEVRAYPEMR